MHIKQLCTGGGALSLCRTQKSLRQDSRIARNHRLKAFFPRPRSFTGLARRSYRSNEPPTTRAVPHLITLVACSPIVVATTARSIPQWHRNCARCSGPAHQCQCSIFRAACRRVCCRKRSAFNRLSRSCEGAGYARRCSSLPAHLLWRRPRSLHGLLGRLTCVS